MIIYGIKDIKVGAFRSIFTALSDVEASRQLIMALKGNAGQLSMFPEDFALMRVGTLHETSGLIHQSEFEPEFIISATTAKGVATTPEKESDNDNSNVQ